MNFPMQTTLMIGLNYGEPAGEALKGKPIGYNTAMFAIKTAMADAGIEGYTLTNCTGYWQGNPEDSIKVEVFHDYGPTDLYKNVARAIKAALHQEAVLVSTACVDATLV